DGDLWQWWDRVAWAVEETECRSLTLELDGRPEVYRWDSRGEAIAVADRLAYRLKEVDESVRLRTLELLEEKLAVTIPVSAPEAYAPMSWEQVRGLAARGFEFSPHTVTHPILTRVDREQAKREIEESRARCEAELGWQPRTFCYPDGSAEAFSEREAAIVQELGFKGAVTALHGYVPMSEEVDPFRLRRFPFPFHLSDFIQIVSGLEHLKMKLRGAR
ncbi:MAG: polysaccharide deacetylase family protein, partial [Myxococcota bacterium]